MHVPEHLKQIVSAQIDETLKRTNYDAAFSHQPPDSVYASIKIDDLPEKIEDHLKQPAKTLSIGTICPEANPHAAIGDILRAEAENLVQEQRTLHVQKTKKAGKIKDKHKSALLPDVYLPYQVVMEIAINNAFDAQEPLKKLVMGMVVQRFAAHANRYPQYQTTRDRLEAQLTLMQRGETENIGFYTPLEQLPSLSIMFKFLKEFNLIKEVEEGFYLLASLPVEPKKKWFYPVINECVFGLVETIKQNKIKVLLDNDYNLCFPKEFKCLVLDNHADHLIQNETSPLDLWDDRMQRELHIRFI